MQMKYVLNGRAQSASPLRKLATLILAIVMLGLVVMFSVVALTIILVVGVVAFAYLWWKTRKLRRMMRMMQSLSTAERRRQEQASNDGVFEGEAVVVVEPQERK